MKRGFTLIELLVVIAIIGILSAVVLAALSTARGRANDAARESEVKQIRNALELYANDHNGSYPSTGGVDICLGLTSAQTCWSGVHGSDTLNTALAPYISQIPADPLPNRIYGAYIYESPVAANSVYDNPGGGAYVYSPTPPFNGNYFIAWKPRDNDASSPNIAECLAAGGVYGSYDNTGGAVHCAVGGTCRQCGVFGN